MARKLSKGVHWVNIKGKRRKVRVLANGKWRFLKSSGTSRKTPRTKRKTSTRRGARRASKPMAKRRRRYTRRRTGGGRKRFVLPSLAMAGVAALAARNFRFGDALRQLFSGDFQGAMNVLGNAAANPRNYIAPIGGAMVVGMVRDAVGPKSIGRIGRFNIRLL